MKLVLHLVRQFEIPMERQDAAVLGAMSPGPGEPPPLAELLKAWPLSTTDFRLRRTGLFTAGSSSWVLDGCLLHHPATQRSWDWLTTLSEHTSCLDTPVLVPTAALARGRVLFQLRRYQPNSGGCLIELVVFDPAARAPWLALRGPGPLRWAGVQEVRHLDADVVFLLGPGQGDQSARFYTADSLPEQPAGAYRLDFGHNTYEAWTGAVPPQSGFSLFVAIQGGSAAEGPALGRDSIQLRLAVRGAAVCIQHAATQEESEVPLAKPLARSASSEELVRAASDGGRLLIMDATRGDVVRLSHYHVLPRGPHGPLAAYPMWHPPAHRRPPPASGEPSAPKGTLPAGAGGRRWSALAGFAVHRPVGRYGSFVLHDGQHELTGAAASILVFDRRSCQLIVNDDQLAELLQECTSAVALTGPNLVQIRAAGRFGDGVAVALAPLEGETLHDFLARERRVPYRTAARMAHGIAVALAAIEAAGWPLGGRLVRRVTPMQVRIMRGPPLRVKVMPFPSDVVHQGSMGELDPTLDERLPYLTPEQLTDHALASAGPVAPTEPVWWVGALVLELLTGESPFRRPSACETMMRILAAIVPELPLDVPATLAQIVKKALARNPADRYPSVGMLLQALAAYLAAE